MQIALALVGVIVGIAIGMLWSRRASRTSTDAAPAVAAETAPAVASEVATGALTTSADAAALAQLRELAEDRRRLFHELARARGDIARYRQLVIDVETNAPLPLLGGPGTPDDLKLIVGIGPVLERMLHQLGITTYRQIARWNERDIEVFDARLSEFPGRIRRDAWVTQARALHQSVHGDTA